MKIGRKRYFRRSCELIGSSGVVSRIDHWKWVKGRGLFVKFLFEKNYTKSEYNLKELLSGIPEGKVIEFDGGLNENKS